MWGLLWDVAFWGAVWLVVASALGILVGKGIAVGMGTHPHAPCPEAAAADDPPSAEPKAPAPLLAEVAALTDALDRADADEATRQSTWRQAG